MIDGRFSGAERRRAWFRRGDVGARGQPRLELRRPRHLIYTLVGEGGSLDQCAASFLTRRQDGVADDELDAEIVQRQQRLCGRKMIGSVNQRLEERWPQSTVT